MEFNIFKMKNYDNINIDELQTKIVQIEIENKKLKDKNKEIKQYSEEIGKELKMKVKIVNI